MSQEAESSARDPNRAPEFRENIKRMMQEIITNANMEGWGSLEVLDLMEEVLQKLRLSYADEPAPASALIEGDLKVGSLAVEGEPIR